MKSITKLCWTAIALPTAITPIISLASCGNKQSGQEQEEVMFDVTGGDIKDCYEAQIKLVWARTDIQFELSNFSFKYDNFQRTASLVLLSETSTEKVFQLNLIDPIVDNSSDGCVSFHYKNVTTGKELDYMINDVELNMSDQVRKRIISVGNPVTISPDVLDYRRSDLSFNKNTKYQICFAGWRTNSTGFDLTRNNVVIDVKLQHEGNKQNPGEFPGTINYVKYGSTVLKKDVDYDVTTWSENGFFFRIKHHVMTTFINDIQNNFVIDLNFGQVNWEDAEASFAFRLDN